MQRPRPNSRSRWLGRLGPLALNLALAAGTTLMLVLGLEAVCRVIERPPQDAPDVEVADWTDWDGEFFTARGWSPARDFNSDGLRDRERAVAKLPGTRRLMCLGDSTTYGFHLRPEQAYPQLLQELLDARGAGIEVFNVALPGWSARQQLIAYRRLGRRAGEVADRIVCIASHARRYKSGFWAGGLQRDDVQDAEQSVIRAIELLRDELRPGDVVLLKGQGTQRLERIALGLQGRAVRCDIRHCPVTMPRCVDCSWLERGWTTPPP